MDHDALGSHWGSPTFTLILRAKQCIRPPLTELLLLYYVCTIIKCYARDPHVFRSLHVTFRELQYSIKALNGVSPQSVHLKTID